ncbi:MAG: ATP-binding cassette domain-containing protein [Actinomycetes bacterium]
MIRFDHVTFTYPDSVHPTLSDVNVTIPEGELCLVVGRTGSGKSTLLRAVNGLVPRFTGGHLAGSVQVAGRRTEDYAPRDLADIVGVVGQDPAAGFVTDTVEDELAYAMENLGIAPDVMRRRVEDTLDLLGLHELRDRPLLSLSGGQQQRVAIGSVLTTTPQILVLDEPTSALDPAAAEEVLAALTRLVHDVGITVLIAEHRLERVVQYADRIIYLPGQDGRVEIGEPASVMVVSPVVPPVVELGRLAGWSPLPLTVRDARRLAEPLRERLKVATPPLIVAPDGDRVASVRSLHASFGPVVALRGIDLDLHAGEVLALMGRNGAGKSTVLSHLVGLRVPQSGRVEVMGSRPDELSPADAIRLIGMVPQDAGILLNAETVDAECQENDRDGDLAAGTTAKLLNELVPGIDGLSHPRDLSEGQRLSLALAVILAAEPPIVLLDEPTRGLDYEAKDRLISWVTRLTARGHCVVFATHDVEVVARVADRVVVLADGEVVANGPARDVVSHSPVFAPQVAKVLAPESWLTVAEVADALTASAS